ncbi:MAG: hypothetical protein ACI4M8_05195 [Christensenellales bacterium]
MKKIICLIVCLLACGLTFSACSKDEPHTHTYSAEWSFDQTYHWHAATCEHTAEVSEKSEHTLVNGVCSVCGNTISAAAQVSAADCAEAFDAVREILNGNNGASAMSIVTLNNAGDGTVGYFGLGLSEDQLEAYENDIGVTNSIAFTYFFSEILKKDDYVMSDEAFVYAAEESAVATGKLQVYYDGDCLYGSMYMLPIGVTGTGLFTIIIDYDFATGEVIGFEWLLRGIGGSGSYYFIYKDGAGYTVSGENISAVASYLDDKLNDYEVPASTDVPYDVVAEWTATTEYINNMMSHN